MDNTCMCFPVRVSSCKDIPVKKDMSRVNHCISVKKPCVRGIASMKDIRKLRCGEGQKLREAKESRKEYRELMETQGSQGRKGRCPEDRELGRRFAVAFINFQEGGCTRRQRTQGKRCGS